MWCRSRNGQWMQMGAVKNQERAKKDLKMSHFTHFKKLMKNNKFSSSQYKFSKHIGPMECNRLKTTKNSTLATKTGYAEVKKITKNDQQDKNAPKSETRSLDLSRVRRHFQKKSGRQTVFFFKKTFEMAVYYFKYLLHYSET